MGASKEMILRETVIESEEQKLIFSTPLTVHINCKARQVTLESNLGIAGAGSDFESAWKNLRAEIFKRWNDPVLRDKHFPSEAGIREATVTRATSFKWAANQ
jgi:hypothetical protein